MPVIILSSAYLPPISYFEAIASAGSVLIEAHETYPRQTYRNRCHIYGPNGLLVLSIPVNKPDGNRTKTNQVILSDNKQWRNNHWRSFEAAYNSSPFFMFYRDQLEKCYENPPELLLEFNSMLLKSLLNMLGLNIEINFTTNYFKMATGIYDLRNIIHPKRNLTPLFFCKQYSQVFASKYDFLNDLSIIDLLFNEGPAASGLIGKVNFDELFA